VGERLSPTRALSCGSSSSRSRCGRRQNIGKRRSVWGPRDHRRLHDTRPSHEVAVCQARGGYRDPESQALIESWFAKPKERCIWLHEFETLEQAREVIAAYVDRYHDRPHSGLAYRTPVEVAQTWKDGQARLKHAA
jgi:Integrase core domain